MSGQPTTAVEDPADNLSSTVLGVTVAFTAVTVVFLGCRLASRYITASGVKLDDYSSIAATVSPLIPRHTPRGHGQMTLNVVLDRIDRYSSLRPHK